MALTTASMSGGDSGEQRATEMDPTMQKMMTAMGVTVPTSATKVKERSAKGSPKR